MDWLADLISKLPMDAISEAVSRLTLWWTNLVADVPEDELPMKAYVGFSAIVLVLWLFIVRVLPRPIGGMSWLAVFAVLLTPGLASGDSGDIAPASIGVVYGILMKDPGLALRNLLPILVVFSAGLFLGFIWNLIKNIVESTLEKSRQKSIAEEKERVRLAAANYVELVESDLEPATSTITQEERASFAQVEQQSNQSSQSYPSNQAKLADGQSAEPQMSVRKKFRFRKSNDKDGDRG